VEPGFTFAFANELSDRFGLGYNMGVNWSGDNLQYHFGYTIALSYSISDKIGIYGEFFGQSTPGEEAPNTIDGGVTVLLWPNFQLDATVGYGVSEPARDLLLGFGFSWRIPE